MKLITKLFITVSVCCLFISCSYYEKSISFDSEKWKTADSETKHLMADDIIKNDLLKDKTKADVLELLGEPYKGVNPENHEWYYKLNETEWFNYGFIVRFDKSTEKVKLTGIVD
jgi:outer membrane protein assembly factor BamE (lipoprotein component of BamABCDE complex)